VTRGEIWWPELAGEAGFRPVVVVSCAEGAVGRKNVIVAEVTRAVRCLPCEVPLSIADGMPTECVVKTDNLHPIPRDRLWQTITTLSPEKVFALGGALRYSLDLEG
jgi:mRNA-degrading endonuclease toxin of MazEF toxin-antitoxin module